jgi:23S rRNA pseudouridine2604 synthase
MRINKYLAHEQYCTRREADELIQARKVLINGVPAQLGDKDATGPYYKPRPKNEHGVG